jgi:multicomponent Na+:H+ antiporter subunit C
VLLSQAVNLFIFTSGKMQHGNPPIAPMDAEMPVAPFVDPLPQALILTAIVISFGVLAFALVLMHRMYETVGADDLNKMRSTDR